MCGGKNPDGASSKQVDEDCASQITSSFKPTGSPQKASTKKFLETILASKELTQALESFLQAEFCLENLLFIQKVGKYKESLKKVNFEDFDKRKAQDLARQAIQKEFMLLTSEREVNLPAKAKQECLATVERLKTQGLKMESEEYGNLARSVFEECENHIKMVLIQERIGRFQTTEAFTELSSRIPRT